MKTRIFFCEFWEDFEANGASLSARLLGAFCWTNNHANLIGVYGMTTEHLALETKLSKREVGKAKDELEKLKIVHFCKNYIYLPNAQKRCGYISETKHGIAIQRELARIPGDVLEHFRSIGYTIPYHTSLDMPLNPIQETKNSEQESNKTKNFEPTMMTNDETDQMVNELSDII